MAGLLYTASNADLDREAAKRAAEQRQAEPLIVGLAGHLMRLWHPAWLAKKPIEDKMLRALRQRRGEYETDVLNAIKATGGSEIYMLLTETKCRAASSWIRDILFEGDTVLPYDIEPPPVNELPPDTTQEVLQIFGNKVVETIQQTGIAPNTEEMDDLKTMAEQDARFELQERMKVKCDAMKDLMEDQFEEGGLIEGASEFVDDLVTYPAAFLVGPIVRRMPQLDWLQDTQTGQYTPQVTEKLVPTYNRFDPYRVYPEPGVTRLDDGYLFLHHRLTESDLSDLIGCPGYDDDALRAVLREMPSGGLQNWMWSAEMQKSRLEEKHDIWMRVTRVVDALQFYGRIEGRLLREWGMSLEEIQDEARYYHCEVWMIGRWVVKATLNYDPLGKKPIYKTSMYKIPGAFWGEGVPPKIEDLQTLCNAAARALSNNMGLASGPQVELNVERIPQDEEVTQIFPWKIWQVTNDPMGSGQPAVRFSQPDSHAQELMQVYIHYSKLADDQSGIPAYVYGDMQVGGAGRTASGLSMLMGSAGKGIRQVIMHIDTDVIGPLVKAQYSWNMRYVEDQSVKGPANCVPRGAVVLANREQLNVRRMEFLQATANPIDSQIMGMPGRRNLLAAVAKGLSMEHEEIVPSEEKVETMQRMQELAQQAQQQGAGPQQVQFQRDHNGVVTGAQVGQGTQQSPPAQTDAAGNKAGGTNLVANQRTGR